MIKILHTADLHLDSPLNSLALRDENLKNRVQVATRETLKKIVNIAIEENVIAVLICGDLFDRIERSANTSAFLMIQIHRLKRAGIHVFYIKGNHDVGNPISVTIDFPNNVHCFDAKGGYVQLDSADVCIHGISFSGKTAPESLIPKFKPPMPGMVNIAMMHTSVNGSAGHDIYAPCKVNEMISTGFDYWALGHIHKRKVYAERPWIVMPGMPQGRDVGESGTKSITLINIEDRQVIIKEVFTSVVEFGEIEIDTTSLQDIDSLYSAIHTNLQNFKNQLQSSSGIARVTLKGKSELNWQIHRDRDSLVEMIRDYASEIGEIGIDKVKLETSEKQAIITPDATTELAEIMNQLQNTKKFNDKFLGELNQLIGQLPSKVRSKLLNNEDAANALVEQLSRNGARRVIAAMRTNS